jgi:hypothetical protein
MNAKITTPVLFASLSLAALLAALFVPLFFAIGSMIAVTASVWEISRVLTLLCAAAISVVIFLPLIRPKEKAWLWPFLLGAVTLTLTVCSTIYTFSFAERFNLYFHPYGLILLALGALLCATEGLWVRAQSRSAKIA